MIPKHSRASLYSNNPKLHVWQVSLLFTCLPSVSLYVYQVSLYSQGGGGCVTCPPLWEAESSKRMRCGWPRIKSSDSQVASSSSHLTHCTKCSIMVRFWRRRWRLEMMRSGGMVKSFSSLRSGKVVCGEEDCPSFFLRQETWNTLWILVPGGRSRA